MKYQDTSSNYETALGEKIMTYDGVAAISFTSDLIHQIDNMLRSLDIVIVVLMVSAGLLAFVVLYNLNNINITERQRELATLKVLGFFDGEVASYVYRENMVLTLFGVIAGMGIGTFLHHCVIQTVEVDMMMFGRNVFPRSYGWSALITLAYALFVNFMMFYRLRKIDMIESLKEREVNNRKRPSAVMQRICRENRGVVFILKVKYEPECLFFQTFRCMKKNKGFY